eukprot:g10563.t1
MSYGLHGLRLIANATYEPTGRDWFFTGDYYYRNGRRTPGPQDRWKAYSAKDIPREPRGPPKEMRRQKSQPLLKRFNADYCEAPTACPARKLSLGMWQMWLSDIRLPDSLKHLTFGMDFNASLDNAKLPSKLQSLTFGHDFNESLDHVKLPDGLQSLTFGHDFNESLDDVELPDGLQSLKFGSKFDQSLEDVKLPQKLRNLTFGSRFDQSLDHVNLPDGLLSMSFGYRFNQALEDANLPSGLQALAFGHGYSQSFQHVDLPQGLQRLNLPHGDVSKRENHLTLPKDLQHLTCGCGFVGTLEHLALLSSLQSLTLRGNESLEHIILPSGLQSLDLGDDFNQSLEHIHMPKAMRSLTFGDDFNHSLADINLPDGLQSLTLGYRFQQSLEYVNLPNKLQSLTLGFGFNQSLERVTLPKGLQSLTLGNRFNRSLEHVLWPFGLQSLTLGDRFNRSLDHVNLPHGLQSLKIGHGFNRSLAHVDLPIGLESLSLGDSFNSLDQEGPRRAAEAPEGTESEAASKRSSLAELGRFLGTQERPPPRAVKYALFSERVAFELPEEESTSSNWRTTYQDDGSRWDQWVVFFMPSQGCESRESRGHATRTPSRGRGTCRGRRVATPLATLRTPATTPQPSSYCTDRGFPQRPVVRWRVLRWRLHETQKQLALTTEELQRARFMVGHFQKYQDKRWQWQVEQVSEEVEKQQQVTEDLKADLQKVAVLALTHRDAELKSLVSELWSKWSLPGHMPRRPTKESTRTKDLTRLRARKRWNHVARFVAYAFGKGHSHGHAGSLGRFLAFRVKALCDLFQPSFEEKFGVYEALQNTVRSAEIEQSVKEKLKPKKGEKSTASSAFEELELEMMSSYTDAFEEAGGDYEVEAQLPEVTELMRLYRRPGRVRQDLGFEILGLQSLYSVNHFWFLKFEEEVNRLAQQTRAVPQLAPLKSYERARAKVLTRYGGDVSCLTDVMRASLVYPTIAEVYLALTGILREDRDQPRHDFRVMEVNDRFQFCHDGYRDITLLFDMSGVICEVQMQIKDCWDSKEWPKRLALHVPARGIEGHASAAGSWQQYLARR